MRFNAPRHSYESRTPFATEVTASVRFFDAERGFGFVMPDGGGADAFLPARLVEAAGRGHLPEGTTLTVDLVEGDRGPQVSRIYRFDLSTAVPRPAARPSRSRSRAARWRPACRCPRATS